ncbi:MAG: DUF6057 family protein [Prevotella sp.]|nr:DUF6057 family protein [Prevotella sp.]
MKKIVRYFITCLVGILIYLFWAIPLRGMLNYHEEFQLFQTGSDYFVSHLTQRGGLSVYISEFLIQFYNNYWIGALIITLEFVLIQWLSLDILKNILPTWSKRHAYLAFFLSFVPMLLLWIILGDVNVMHSVIIAVIIALILIDLLVRIFRNKLYRILGAVVAILLFVWLAGTSHYRIPSMHLDISNIYNPKTIELLDYDLLVRANRWNQVIRKAEKQQPDLPLSVCATNLALGMTNQLGNRAGDFFQNGPEGLFPSFSKDPFSTLTTAEVYFQLGLINTAQRYYFEAMEAAPNYKKSCRCIRRLAETNLINGQYSVARKYLHLLEKTLIYRKWAQRTLSMINRGESAIMSHSLYGRLRRMRLSEDFLYNDQEVDKVCGLLLMQNHENVLAMQYMLLYPLLENNYDKFVQYMRLVKDEVPYTMEFASFEKYLRQR